MKDYRRLTEDEVLQLKTSRVWPMIGEMYQWQRALIVSTFITPVSRVK